jgi:flagellar biosynthesis protein FlhA
VQKLLKDLPAEQKKLVDDLIPSVVTATTIQRVLQALLRERSRSATCRRSWKASARPRRTPLGHPAGRAGPRPPGPPALLRQPRRRRRPADRHPVAEWEHAFADALVGPGEDKQLALAPSRLQEFIRGVRDAFERAAMAGDSAVLLTSPGIRPYVRSIIERFRGQTVVMSQNEIHPRARLRTVGTV